MSVKALTAPIAAGRLRRQLQRLGVDPSGRVAVHGDPMARELWLDLRGLPPGVSVRMCQFVDDIGQCAFAWDIVGAVDLH